MYAYDDDGKCHIAINYRKSPCMRDKHYMHETMFVIRRFQTLALYAWYSVLYCTVCMHMLAFELVRAYSIYGKSSNTSDNF